MTTELIEHRATNPWRSERAERESAGRIERIDGGDEAEGAGADELVELEIHADAAGHLARNEVHESEVLGDHALAVAAVAVDDGAGLGGRLGGGGDGLLHR